MSHLYRATLLSCQAKALKDACPLVESMIAHGRLRSTVEQRVIRQIAQPSSIVPVRSVRRPNTVIAPDGGPGGRRGTNTFVRGREPFDKQRSGLAKHRFNSRFQPRLGMSFVSFPSPSRSLADALTTISCPLSWKHCTLGWRCFSFLCAFLLIHSSLVVNSSGEVSALRRLHRLVRRGFDGERFCLLAQMYALTEVLPYANYILFT